MRAKVKVYATFWESGVHSELIDFGGNERVITTKVPPFCCWVDTDLKYGEATGKDIPDLKVVNTPPGLRVKVTGQRKYEVIRDNFSQ